MNVMIIEESQLEGSGYDYKYAKRLKDGRVILPLNALKVLTNITPSIVSTQELAKIQEEEARKELEEQEKKQNNVEGEEV